MTFTTNISIKSSTKAYLWLAALLLLSGMLASTAPFVSAQTVIGPEQDCFNALPVVRNIILQQLSYSGAGQNGTDIGMTPNCGTVREVNSVWYRINVGAAGNLAFTITPNNNDDDYNFVAYRAPATTSGFVDCLGIANGVNFAACNFNPGTATGADNALNRSFPGAFTPAISVNVGDIVLLCVSNVGGRSGFRLDFSNSTQGVIPISAQQAPTTTAVTAVQTALVGGGCSAPTVINLTFSQPVLRGSIQPSSFTIQNADGTRNFAVTAAACSSCPSGNTGRQTFSLTITPPITESGVYRIATNNTASAIVARDIFNAPLVVQAQNFIVNVGNIIPTVQVGALPPSNARQEAAFCLGRSITLTAEDGGPGATYQWLSDNGGGVFMPIEEQSRRSIIFTGRYQGETLRGDGGDSVIVFIDEPIPVRVRITDQNGCVRFSTSTNVTARGGRQAAMTLSNGRTYTASQNPRVERICFVDGVTFTAEAGFRSYQWYFNGSPVDTAINRTFFARALGNYTVETTDENGCLNKPAEILLETLSSATPVINGPDVNCPNPATGRITSTVTLTASNDPSYRTIQWLDSLNRPILGASTNTLSVTTGTFSFRAITSEGCAVQVTKTVRPGQNPGGPIRILNSDRTSFICPGTVALLQATTEYFSYRWFFNGSLIPIPGATQRTYTTTIPGSYQVQGVTAEGCTTLLSSPIVVAGSTITTPTIRPGGGILRFCRGSSIDLSVDGGDNFEWFYQAGQGAMREFLPQTRSVNVNRPGIYSVRVTFNDPSLAGCAVTSSATLVVVDNPMPIVINPASDSTFCQGGSLTLNAETGFETYQWFRNGLPIQQGGTMRSFVVTQTGNYSVRVTAAGGCSGTSGERSVREVPTPDIPRIGSNNDFLLCPNSATDIFVSNTQQGITYQWFREGQTTAIGSGPRLTVTQIGSYTVEARGANGCTSRPMSPSVVQTAPVPTPPRIDSALIICPNASRAIDAGPDYTSYQWFRNGDTLRGETSQIYTVRSGGRYTVRVSNNRGCFVTSREILVTQTVVSVTIATLDGGARFRARSTPPPQRFQWLLNGMNILGAIDSVFAPTVPGLYNVRITDINMCVDTGRAVRFEPPVVEEPRVTCATAGAVVPCTPIQVSTMGGTTTTNIVGIGTSNAVAAPGDTIAFRFTLASFGTLEPGARISADLCFNATMLEPLPPLAGGTITNSIRCIPVNFTLPANISDALLNGVFRAALGNDSITAIRLQNVRLQPSQLALRNSTGSFRLTNISYAGGPRLIGPPPRMRLSPTAQNPTSDVASIGYTLENISAANQNAIPILPVNISLSDVYGRVVKVSDVQQLIGSNGEISMDVRDLVPGVYFMTVRTKDAVAVQRIHILR
ncbi:MAG: T9SS C-terminal target domain-containing protein [Candidatus Kapaibacterium sp.]|nr:MAG: T9SS C-terminal target domain-containing protein [Candidatus Kapabacteria bacterium]